MPRVHFVKKARKDYPQAGIMKGDSYYWWEFRYGGTRMSKTPPKPSQLTQSDFLQRIYGINERIEALETDIDNIESERDEIVSELEEIRDECEEKRSNMPDHLQDVGSGEILQNRYDAVDDMINELQNIDLDFEELPDEPNREDFESEEEYEEAKEEYDEAVERRDQAFEVALEEIKAISYNGE
jgi:chromosome segregation ATPase